MKTGEKAKGLDLGAGVLKGGGVVKGLWTNRGRKTVGCGG